MALWWRPLSAPRPQADMLAMREEKPTRVQAASPATSSPHKRKLSAVLLNMAHRGANMSPALLPPVLSSPSKPPINSILSPPSRRCEQLPTEILYITFESLSDRQDLRACSLVCRSWYPIAQRCQWRTITVPTLTAFHALLSVLKDKRYLLRYTVCMLLPFLDHLPVFECPTTEAAIWWHVGRLIMDAPHLSFVSGLEKAPLSCYDVLCRLPGLLCLNYTPQLLHSMQKVLAGKRSQLRENSLFPKVFMLLKKGDDDRVLDAVTIDTLGCVLPKLGVLEMAIASPQAARTFFDVASHSWTSLFMLTLEIKSLTHVPAFTSDGVLPSLRTLNLVVLDDNDDNDDTLLSRLLPRFPNLRTFGVVSESGITSNTFHFLAKYCPHICELAGALSPTFSIVDAEKSFPMLRHLHSLVMEMTASTAELMASINITSWFGRLRAFHMHLPQTFDDSPSHSPMLDHLLHILSQLKAVERLHIIPGLSDSDADEVSWPPGILSDVRTFCPNLRELGLVDGIWPASRLFEVKSFISLPPKHFSLLSFRLCPEMERRDIEIHRLKLLGEAEGVILVDLVD
ncbi:hypothetical protein HDU67_010127 [Dinochytrium kinnereticum]|nr:hypothetical protein HDU67_010127 [Dinochytrium kinnereticum]